MSSSFSARWVCSITPLSRASAAASAISPVETEKGEQGASPTRTIAPGEGSWNASTTRTMSARIAGSASTTLSGGSPPALSPTLIAPRVGWKRMPTVAGRLDRVLEPRPVREEIEMVRAHGAARERQLGEPELRRDEHVLRLIPRPDRIERLQPAEEQRVLPRRHRPRQGLVEVVVGVDEPRRHHAAARVDHLALRSPPTAADGRGSPRPRPGSRRRRARAARRPW